MISSEDGSNYCREWMFSILLNCLLGKGYDGARKMTQWVKFLLCKLEDLSLDPQHLGKKPDMVAGAL